MSTAALLVVGVLALPGVSNTEFVRSIDVFVRARFRSQPAPDMKVVVIALERGGVRGVVVGATP